MSVEQTIREGIEESIHAMTGPGYVYDWSNATVQLDNYDFNSVPAGNFPAVAFELDNDLCDNQELNQGFSSHIIECKLDIVPKKTGVTVEDVDNIRFDIQKMLHNNPNLSGSCFYAFYKSYQRYYQQVNGPAYGMTITIGIRYRVQKY